MSWRSLWAAFSRPVPTETKENLKRIESRFPAHARGKRQMIGRHAEGCSALIGAMPRCDFACSGCYLGESANRTPRATRTELERQLRALRAEVGRFGNLQLTDGELTLLPATELIELVQLAREHELTPMLMTHGDVIRRNPELLVRLMREGGLQEISFHIDTTQRGRRGAEFKHARTERELMPLRDEFARIIREARQQTKLPLRVATTVTITTDNVGDVPQIVSWHLANADAFRILTFLPMAQVGRTEEREDAVSTDELWLKIAAGLNEEGAALELERGRLHFGHPACSRVVLGVATRGRYRSLRLEGDRINAAAFDGFVHRFGGLMLRGDSTSVKWARLLGVFCRAPLFFAVHGPRYAWHWLGRLASPGEGRLRTLAGLFRSKARPQGLAIVSHHFMNSDEIETELGRERLASCVFHVAPNGEKISMCAANASDLRDRYYQELRGEPEAGPVPEESASELVGTS